MEVFLNMGQEKDSSIKKAEKLFTKCLEILKNRREILLRILGRIFMKFLEDVLPKCIESYYQISSSTKKHKNQEYLNKIFTYSGILLGELKRWILLRYPLSLGNEPEIYHFEYIVLFLNESILELNLEMNLLTYQLIKSELFQMENNLQLFATCVQRLTKTPELYENIMTEFLTAYRDIYGNIDKDTNIKTYKYLIKENFVDHSKGIISKRNISPINQETSATLFPMSPDFKEQIALIMSQNKYTEEWTRNFGSNISVTWGLFMEIHEKSLMKSYDCNYKLQMLKTYLTYPQSHILDNIIKPHNYKEFLERYIDNSEGLVQDQKEILKKESGFANKYLDIKIFAVSYRMEYSRDTMHQEQILKLSHTDSCTIGSKEGEVRLLIPIKPENIGGHVLVDLFFRNLFFHIQEKTKINLEGFTLKLTQPTKMVLHENMRFQVGKLDFGTTFLVDEIKYENSFNFGENIIDLYPKEVEKELVENGESPYIILTVLKSNEITRGASYQLNKSTKSKFLIGRNYFQQEDVPDVKLSTQEISRKHCEIRYSSKRKCWLLAEFKGRPSHFGTYVFLTPYIKSKTILNFYPIPIRKELDLVIENYQINLNPIN